MHRRGKCGMVIIDYLQLLDTSTRNPNTTREREIAAISRSAKLLAKEFDVPVILISQLSRDIEKEPIKRRYYLTLGSREPLSRMPTWCCSSIVR